MKKIIIIGGGAAGIFGAIRAAELNPDAQIVVLEKSNQLLGKVKISGGGRCNVTHACFVPEELITFYPRGGKELLGAFHQFMPTNTFEWFQQRGVELKTEADNRVFPKSDKSQTIIDCFLNECRKRGVKIITACGVQRILKNENGFQLDTEQGLMNADTVLLATGSSPKMWDILKELHMEIIPPVPSLFTFNINDARIKELPGLSVPNAIVQPENSSVISRGPLLITHWGMSGPAILKCSAWAARELADINYNFSLRVNWTGIPLKEVQTSLKKQRDLEGKKICGTNPQFGMPTRLWKSLTEHLSIDQLKWASMSNKQLDQLADELAHALYTVNGKSTFKDEFVTSGGISLQEVNMKTMESKKIPGLFFAGEVLNIDAVTGGFNFQAAWTTSWIAAGNL